MKGRTPFRIVVAEPFQDEIVDRLRTVAEVVVLPDPAPETLLKAMPGAHALLVNHKAHVTARIINASHDLRVIGRASHTIDHIDLKAAKRRSIPVVYCPNAAVSSTAEFALTLLMAVHRRLPFFDSELRDGRFEAARHVVGRELRSSVVGLLGCDPVAIRLAEMISTTFGSEIISCDPQTGATAGPGRTVDLDELLSKSDALTIHLRMGPGLRGFLNAERLAKMKPTAVIVNVSRGGVIDTTALADALVRGTIGGAGLDVFESEPLPLNHPIRSAPNCVLTPHVASTTIDTNEQRLSVADDVIRVLVGESPNHQAADS